MSKTKLPSRAEVAGQYDLTGEEKERLYKTSVGDPVSDYFGFYEIQAQMIVDERPQQREATITNIAPLPTDQIA